MIVTKVKDAIWLSGILISFVSIPVGLLFAGGDLYSPSSYKPVLPSITFIAASVATLCLLEAVELLMEIDFTKMPESTKLKVFLWILSVVAASFFYYSTFILNIMKVSQPVYSVDWSVLILNVAMVFAATILAARVRRELGAYK